ncbi:hypothetical protein [Chryseobacterium sp. FH1]|uniref:hypothetical protein n=1 Tax=Chryseobacterium sp. FH1 TaxID=1233951 RepID=UPI0004E2C2B2|nr:hypothetical protein [Chryseobacterium sp. FH1]KFC19922.1 hypothetical protein IO90_11900 [Chryseobacterium sp. FH1]
MKPLFSFLLVFFSLIVYCQEDNYDVAKKEFEKFIFSSDSIQIENIKNEKFENILDIQNFYHPITRTLDFGLKESIYELRFMYSVNRILRGRGVKIFLFYQDGKNVGKIIDYYQYENEAKQISSKFDITFNKYIVKHNFFYNTKTNGDIFLKDILNREVYGDGCGYEMTITRKIDDVERDNVENVEKYIEWMKSYNPELQMWGYSEIYKLLKNNFIEVDSEELKIFNHIKKRNLVIETCSGCTLGIFEKIFK